MRCFLFPLDFEPSDSFREWGFHILPDKVIWHVDGKLLFAWEYTEEYSIDEMYEFFFSAWTNRRWNQGFPAPSFNGAGAFQPPLSTEPGLSSPKAERG